MSDIVLTDEILVHKAVSITGLAHPQTTVHGVAGAFSLDYKINESTFLIQMDNLKFVDAGLAAVIVDSSNSGASVLEVTNSVFMGNNQAIQSYCGGLQITKSSFVGNGSVSATSGGAVYASFYTTLTVSDSVFATNTSSRGGAIYCDGKAATITRSTFSGNVAGSTTQTGTGGAIDFTQPSTAFVVNNSTFVGNSALGPSTALGAGSAMAFNNSYGTQATILNNVTIADNSGAAALSIGTQGSTTVTIANSLFTRNTNGAAAAGDCAGALISAGSNIFSTTAAGCTVTLSDPATVDQTLASPGVAASLANNGGSVPTLALLSGSSALNHGNTHAPASPTLLPVCETTDARGVARPQGAACDVGAFEQSVPTSDLSVSKSASPSPAFVGQPLYYTLTVTNAGPDAAADAQVSDALPSGATFVAAAASQGTCAVNAGNVTCDLGALAASASATVTVTVTPTTQGALPNTAVVQNSGGSDPNGNNDQSTISTQVNAAPAGTCTPGATTCAVCDVCVDCSKACALAQSEYTGQGLSKTTCQSGSPGEMLFWACLVTFATRARRRKPNTPQL